MNDSGGVAFIGLGVMGFPMAGHLARAGHAVRVYNRTRSRADAWVAAHGGTATGSPAEAATGCAFVFSCVGDDPDVREVLLGPDGALGAMRSGAVLVDHTTASPAVAREIAAAARQKGVGFLDAPVSGGQAGAEKGALTVMAGGEPGEFARAEPVIRAYGRTVMLMGPPGAGQLTKIVNQVCIAGVVQGLSEGLNFAMRAGLDGHLVAKVIAGGAAQSWQLENRAPTMLEDRFDFGFAVDWMRKDLRIALDEGRRNGSRLPLTALVDQFYAAVQAQGGGRWDTSSLIRLLRDGS